MRPYLIFLGLGTSGAGIASLVSYGVRATDLQDSLNSSIEYEIENLEAKLKKIKEQEEEEAKRKLLAEEEKRKKEEEERAKIEAERLKQEEIKKSIEELVTEVKSILKKDFPKEKYGSFLNDLSSLWPRWLDSVNSEEFDPEVYKKEANPKNIENTDKFDVIYEKMKDLSGLWKNFTDRDGNHS